MNLEPSSHWAPPARSPHRRSRRTLVSRYLLAVVLVLAAFAGSAVLKSRWNGPSFLFFVPVIAIAAWRGGRGPTVVATTLSFLLIDWFFIPPARSFEIVGPTAILNSIAFLVLAATIIIAMEALQRARARAETVALRASRLLEVTTALSEATTVEEVTAAVLDKGLALLEASHGVLVRSDGTQTELLGVNGLPELDAETRRRMLAPDTAGPVMDSVRTGRPIWLRSVEEFRRRYPLAFEVLHAVNDPRALVAAPLTHGGETFGAISFIFDGASAFGVVDETFTLLLAQATGTALFRAGSYDLERQRRRDAETLARAREDVLGVVAHDLRNPLSVISGATQLLVEEALTPAARAKLGNTSHRAVKQMNRLIEDLLDAVRLQAGTMSLNLEVVPVIDIVQQSEDTFSPLAETQKINFRVDCAPRPDMVRVDPVRLSQVLGNLIGNALKFTPATGTVTLRVGAHSGRALFEVVDTGPGIDQAYLPYVFQDFWQARKGDGRGVGLGLAIAKALVEAHGGELWVESTRGLGSAFCFTVPLISRESEAPSVS
ncbi:MAG: domain S-box [Gemmatimonadetes bacterium]|nr:domain S-box [Gemmatimonadota bacterium]